MKKYALIFAISLLSSGCATQIYNMQVSSAVKVDHEETHHFVVSGFAQTKEVDAGKICGGASRVARIESTVTPLNALLGTITAGFYTPHTVKVFCAVK